MDKTSFDVLGDTLGNRRQDVVEPSPGRVFPLVFFIGLLGIFMLVSLRRVLIIDFRLPWPSSTATGEPCSTHPEVLGLISLVLLTGLCMPVSSGSNHAAACLCQSLLGRCCSRVQETCMDDLTAIFLPSTALVRAAHCSLHIASCANICVFLVSMSLLLEHHRKSSVVFV